MQIGAPPPARRPQPAGRGERRDEPALDRRRVRQRSALHLDVDAQPNSQWEYNDPLRRRRTRASVQVYDRETGTFSLRATRWGSAFRPTLSPDGKWLVYGTRHDQQTGLRIRDLETGEERWLAYPVQRDDQESRASRDVYPGMSFTPDSKFLVATWGGKIWKVPVTGNATPTQIPFSVDVEQHLGPEVRFEYPVSDSATFNVRQIRNAVPSPDGTKLAFTALDRLYVVDVPASGNASAPKKLVEGTGYQFQPAWSPDGRSIAYTTWTEAEAGHIWKVSPDRRSAAEAHDDARATTSSQRSAPDGQRIVAVRGSAPAFAEETSQGGSDFVWIPANGGAATMIMPSSEFTECSFCQRQ